MRDPKRINKLLKLIKEIWECNPDYRFFQLLYNHTRLGTQVKNKDRFTLYIKDPFYYEDDDIIKDLGLTLRNLKKIKEKNAKM